MNIQFIIAMIVGLIIALWTGLAIGNGEYGKAGFVGGGTILAVLMAVIGQRYRFEGWLIAIIVACYFIGGKGFSYQRLVSVIFVGEATLAMLVFFHFFRVLSGSARLLPPHRLATPLFFFLVYGFIHLILDGRAFPLVMVLRDTATVYYALFFFLVYNSMQHKPTREYILKLLPMIAAISMILYTVTVFGGLAVSISNATMLRGAPVILQTIDAMIPICIGFSAFAYFKSLQTSGIWKWMYLLSSILCSAPLFAYGKAVFYLAFASYLGALFVAGQWKIIVTIIPIGICSVFVLIALVGSGIIKDEQGRLKRFMDEFSSFDVVGVGNQASRKNAQRNVDWRLTWWKTVTEDTMGSRPFYGLGMGADISSKFHAEYYNTSYLNTNVKIARYPHNIIFTIIGRMGLIGLIIFIPIAILITRELWIGIHVLRRYGSQSNPRYAFTWAFILAGFVNAFFQSTFEAPYTAVMFWTILALLCVMNQVEHDKLFATKEHEAETPASSGNLQLSKPVAVMRQES
ncbi:MAG: hypothetical protein GY899_18065 [Verrucomicrobiaceae bacterium]|nr:hypothetical protein [Verrucomicrobiaceae bacterium]